MKRKLELSDIAGYLPYGLEVRYLNRIGYIIGFEHNVLRLEYDTEHTFFGCEANIEHCKPILRPMSDLVKPMTHPDINNGEEFVPSNIIKSALLSRMIIENENFWFNVDEECWEGNVQGMRWDSTSDAYQFLNKLHFDYNDLIGQGLAIDINTLN